MLQIGIRKMPDKNLVMLDDLHSDDENIRRSASLKLVEIVEQNPSVIREELPQILEVLKTTDDDYVILQLSAVLEKLFATDMSLPRTFARDIFAFFEKMIQEGRLASDESLAMGGAVRLIQSYQSVFLSDQELAKEAFPVLTKLLTVNSSIKWSAYSIVNQISMHNPNLLKENVRSIFAAVAGGFPELMASLMNLYSYDPQAFIENIEVIIEYAERDPNNRSTALNLLYQIAKDQPNAVADYVDKIIPYIHSPITSSLCCMILAEVARHKPESVGPTIEDLKKAYDNNPSVRPLIPNILGLIGKQSDEQARAILEILNQYLDSNDQYVLAATLSEFKNIAGQNRELIMPYLERIRAKENDPQEFVRDQAIAIIDFVERRDARSLASQIEEQNAKIKEAVKSVDDLIKYVDDNVSILKDFIADVTKKLPVPIGFSIKGKIRRTLILEFACSANGKSCLYPKDRVFTTETKAWSKWLKIAFSAVKIGKAVIYPVSAGDAVGAIKEAYEAYKEKEDADFLSYISEPFLTSSEQDNLIEQLRESNFFRVFNYNPQTASWDCIMCNPPSA